MCVCVWEREYAFIQDLIRPAEREREGKCGSFVLVLWHFILNCHANKPHWAEMNYNKLNWTEKNWEIETKCIGTRGGGGGDFLPWCDREFHFLRMQIRRFDSPVESRQWHGALDTMLNFIFLFSFRFIEARSLCPKLLHFFFTPPSTGWFTFPQRVDVWLIKIEAEAAWVREPYHTAALMLTSLAAGVDFSIDLCWDV